VSSSWTERLKQLGAGTVCSPVSGRSLSLPLYFPCTGPPAWQIQGSKFSYVAAQDSKIQGKTVTQIPPLIGVSLYSGKAYVVGNNVAAIFGK